MNLTELAISFLTKLCIALFLLIMTLFVRIYFLPIENWVKKHITVKHPNTGVFAVDWPKKWLDVFNFAFNSRFLSKQRIMACAFWSLFMSLSLAAIWWCFNRNNFSQYLQSLGVESFLHFTLMFVPLPLLVNFLPDFLSLEQTKMFMKFLTKKREEANSILNLSGLTLVALALDFVATTLIFGGWATLFVAFLNFLVGGSFSLAHALRTVYANFELIFSGTGNVDPLFEILCYTTYLSSVWIWLYGLVHYTSVIVGFAWIKMNRFLRSPVAKEQMERSYVFLFAVLCFAFCFVVLFAIGIFVNV